MKACKKSVWGFRRGFEQGILNRGGWGKRAWLWKNLRNWHWFSNGGEGEIWPLICGGGSHEDGVICLWTVGISWEKWGSPNWRGGNRFEGLVSTFYSKKLKSTGEDVLGLSLLWLVGPLGVFVGPICRKWAGSDVSSQPLWCNELTVKMETLFVSSLSIYFMTLDHLTWCDKVKWVS